jgi:uncharacterized protein YgbK (DUF1537 family)
MARLLLSYYGDDFTGSTDALEALSLGGVRTVLFIRKPDADLLARFSDYQAVGLAGSSRSETPAWMDANLTPAFEWLKSLGAAVCHYKVCSTFDSSPKVGSIGRAIEIGRRVFAQKGVPLIVGTPQLKRFTTFGNLFAAYRDQIYRIDRHPVMSRHPVTPMKDADLLDHLAGQTELRGGLIDLDAIRAANAEEQVDRALSYSDFVLLDVADLETQHLAGEHLWRTAKTNGPFVVGASGVEYALLPVWREAGLAPGEPDFAPLPPVEKIAVVSGSVSPTTESQIRHAQANGFAAIAIDPVALSLQQSEAVVAAAVQSGLAALQGGRSVVLYSALGPSADRGAEIDNSPGARHRLGRSLGEILKQLVLGAKLSRAVIAGGDTSSHALGRLEVDALTVRSSLPKSPGVPLCVAHAQSPGLDGLEIALKGGQVGAEAFFSIVRNGR